jgi:preprotein translocase subunit SecY
MWTTLKDAFADKEIRFKILMTLLVLLVFRIGCYIILPGMKFEVVEQIVAKNDLFVVLSTITGGALENGTLFALGIIPYINASIILQLLSLIIPQIEAWNHEGDEGARKRNQWTRYLSILLAIIQSVGIIISFHNGEAIRPTFGSEAVTAIMIIIYLVAGSCLVMWLGERITEYGIGNGMSLLIFVGIIASAGSSLLSAFNQIGKIDNAAWHIIGYVAIVLLTFFFITFMDMAERRITIQYAKQVKGNKIYGGQTTRLPIKINSGGVMPIIFASSFLMFPQMIASFWPQSKFYQWYSQYLGVKSWVYMVVMIVLILFFSFFYSMIQFQPEEVARNLQKYNGFIPGYRPGRPTAQYLAKINRRITFFGAVYLAIVALVPAIAFRWVGEPVGLTNAFSATGMLIVVSVALEVDKSLQTDLMMKHSGDLLK